MSFIFAVLNAINQRKDSQYVRQVALEVSGQARTTDQMSTVIALRDYVRKHVSRAQYPARGRPYLRDTAADILRSGKGRCGEATRAFIGLAETFGIPAQRLYLEGQRRHVVALVTLDRGERLIVDSSETPYIQDVERLDHLLQHPEFDYYSSFNRPRMVVPVPRNAAHLGPLVFYLENPHALRSIAWLLLGVTCISFRLLQRRFFHARKTQTEADAAPENSWQTAPAPFIS